jgi:thiol:disulfide interchange protein DsbD
LGLALKFLSNADLVANWGFFKRELFLGAWVLIALLMSLYLFGAYRIYRQGPKQKLSAGRLIFGILSTVFTLYLILGLFRAIPLKMLSGFPPPDFYSVFEQESDCPLGIDCFKDFEAGMAYAREVNKPVLLDFTGWACVNCRKMEENVWSEPDIYPILKEDVVLISLYIDDRRELPENEQFEYQFDSGRIKTIETVGQKWGTFQTVNFGAASQPYYVMMSPEMELLNPAIQNTDREGYRQWLESGLEAYRQTSMLRVP